MARSIATIQQQLTDGLVSAAAAVGWTLTPSEWSTYDYKKLFIYVVAVCMATFEQLWDAFTADTEALIATAAPQTKAWFQAQMFKFQYSATDPQQVQLDTTTLAPYYPTINTDYQVIKYASVNTGGLGTTLIKIAGAGPAALDSFTVSAAQSYVDTIANPGLTYYVSSSNADQIYIEAQVYYIGMYSAVILGYIKASIANYLQNIPFDGVVSLIDLEIAIRKTQGVNNVVMQNVQIRTDAQAFGDGINLVVANTVVLRQLQTVAGYVILETTTGHQISESLTLIAE